MSNKDGETKKTRVMVFGTFDGVHEGHLDFFKQAKNFMRNSFLIVSIARDKNVLRIKGKYPEYNEHIRMSLVKKSNLVDLVILAGLKDNFSYIVKMFPDIIALGYDQKVYVKELKKYLKNKDISIKIIRLKPYKEKIYKNHLLKKKREI